MYMLLRCYGGRPAAATKTVILRWDSYCSVGRGRPQEYVLGATFFRGIKS